MGKGIKQWLKKKLSNLIIFCMNECLAEQGRAIKQLEKDINGIKKDINEVKKGEKKKITRLNEISTKLNMLGRMVALQNQAGLNAQERGRRIVVSMTSYPDRIATVPVVLERLFCQTVKPDKIVLWLSKVQFPGLEADLPYRLLEMRNQGLDIRWCQDDLKAYKKVLPALEAYPDDLVVIVDDDLIYDVDLIENLYEGYRRFPGAIIASRIHQIVKDEHGEIVSYKEWKKCVNLGSYQSSGDMFFTGGAGTLLPPGALNKEVFNCEVIQSLCPYADDIWLNIMAAIQGTQIVHTGKNCKLNYIADTQKTRLYDINIEANDGQLKNLLEYYGDRIGGIYRTEIADDK